MKRQFNPFELHWFVDDPVVRYDVTHISEISGVARMSVCDVRESAPTDASRMSLCSSGVPNGGRRLRRANIVER